MLGCYWLTRARAGAVGEGKVFASSNELRAAYDHGMANVQAKVTCRIDGKRYDTTVGRVLLSEIVPKAVDFETYVNKVMDKKALGTLIDTTYRDCGEKETVLLADRMRTLGYTEATRAGISIGIKDMEIPKEKEVLVDKAQKEVEEITNQYLEGLITDGERYNKVIDIWAQVTEEVTLRLMAGISVDTESEGDTTQAVVQPDLHDGRLRRPRLAPSRSGSSPGCVASWPSRPARSSRPRSPRTSARASRSSSTSSPPTAPARASRTRR